MQEAGPFLSRPSAAQHVHGQHGRHGLEPAGGWGMGYHNHIIVPPVRRMTQKFTKSTATLAATPPPKTQLEVMV